MIKKFCDGLFVICVYWLYVFIGFIHVRVGLTRSTVYRGSIHRLKKGYTWLILS